jgi:hypothetical protein
MTRHAASACDSGDRWGGVPRTTCLGSAVPYQGCHSAQLKRTLYRYPSFRISARKFAAKTRFWLYRYVITVTRIDICSPHPFACHSVTVQYLTENHTVSRGAHMDVLRNQHNRRASLQDHGRKEDLSGLGTK